MNIRYLIILIVFPIYLYSASQLDGIIKLGFAGDVMLGRMVNEELKQKSYDYPWGSMISALKKNDINFVNLECAITSFDKPTPKVFNFKTDPKNVQVLVQGNITGVSLANNHILDFGVQGLKDTIKYLTRAGIGFTGAGRTFKEAQKPLIIEKNGIRLAFFGFTDNEPSWKAQSHKPGINFIEIDQKNISLIIGTIKKVLGKVDFIIVSLHWGPNMRERPSKEFIDFAHALIDQGVDIIHGHSAHLVQGIEIYKNKIILYDTGDFIDDYMVHPAPLRNDLTCLFNITLNKTHLLSLDLIPCKIENMQVNKLNAEDPEKKWILRRIINLSQKFGTQLSADGSWKK